MRGSRMLVTVAVAGLSLLAGCSSDDENARACQERESIGYEGLASAANDALRGVEFTLSSTGACEDTGKPWTRAQAMVLEWPDRHVGNRFFQQRGWFESDRGFISPDGRYRASNVSARDDALTSESFVIVEFEEVADEAEFSGR